MPVCEICDKDVEIVYDCGKCDILFCSECGSVKEGICRLCREEGFA